MLEIDQRGLNAWDATHVVVSGSDVSRLSGSRAIVCAVAALPIENIRTYTWDLFPVTYWVCGEHGLADGMIGAEVAYGPFCDDFVVTSHLCSGLLVFINADVLVLVLVLSHGTFRPLYN
ncbi:hypothetical protein FGSG_13645 [Fusarium graminearum PH-1]|uniref:hypothetical protein n=1 Tax=Gibberella zeae (strain ATCC MYA-4620 / CBS 123657 / FGSC 9075 / NRRL 31084 / PH-1) TaxID=229533 RepID=UPI00021F1BF5|nr:hypothetical protein FGSG_13645 [Fusarium graminearum PH-1]ESU16405.1 hypothetical protein FGSG_13645 [Fusarium graminearum PH-1]KAI6769377.1 hypothetical protein HG531_010481 [Fusarium graminearum]|eukprot:XP_011327911.1 hypothetical protein FGSG_13645 [Fusarium graminearum PH-1]